MYVSTQQVGSTDIVELSCRLWWGWGVGKAQVWRRWDTIIRYYQLLKETENYIQIIWRGLLQCSAVCAGDERWCLIISPTLILTEPCYFLPHLLIEGGQQIVIILQDFVVGWGQAEFVVQVSLDSRYFVRSCLWDEVRDPWNTWKETVFISWVSDLFCSSSWSSFMAGILPMKYPEIRRQCWVFQR